MSSYSFGQVAQVVKKFTEVGVTPKALSRLGQAKKEQLVLIDAFLQGRVKFTKVSFLNSAGSITLPGVKKAPVLTEGDGVFFWDGAKALFQNVEPHPLPKMKIVRDDLTESRNDFQILEEIGDESVFEIRELSSQLVRLLKKQVGGKEGVLLNNGMANIFYVRNPNNPKRVLYVNVRWLDVAAGWVVSVSPADAIAWNAVRRIFRKSGVTAQV